MASPYGPILTGAGLLQNGKLSKSARDRYVVEVTSLLATGNTNGQGGAPSTRIFNSLIPLPPIAGPEIPNASNGTSEPVFWFKPDPFAALLTLQLQDRKNNPLWHTIFIDILFEKTAMALDVNGSTPLFPIFDVSIAFPNVKGFPITIPDLATQVNMMPPQLLVKLADLGIQLQLPSLPIPPIPPNIPNITPPSIPGVSIPGVPSLALPELLLGLVKMPFDVITQLVLPPDINLVINLPSLPKVVFDIAFDIVVKLLTKLGLLMIVPKLFIASLLIYVKNVVAMLCTDIVGMLVGSGGAMTKTVAGLTGLV